MADTGGKPMPKKKSHPRLLRDATKSELANISRSLGRPTNLDNAHTIPTGVIACCALRFHLSIDEATTTPLVTFLDELKTARSRNKWIDQLEAYGYRVETVARDVVRPRNVPSRNAARDTKWTEWSDAGLEAAQIVGRWNTTNRDQVSVDAVRKAIQRQRSLRDK